MMKQLFKENVQSSPPYNSVLTRTGYFILYATVFCLLLILTGFQNAFAQFKVIAYAPSWSAVPANIQYSKLTHINYAFIRPTSSGGLTVIDQPSKLQDIVSRAHAAGVKVGISIGGWSNLNNSDFQGMASTSSNISNFVNNVINLINQYSLDGADIDWEYPLDGNDPSNYVTMMTQLGSALHARGKYLSAAVAADSYYGNGIYSSVFNAVDMLNLMVYDGDDGGAHSTYNMAVSALDYWLGRGLAPSKAMLGVPFYSKPSFINYSDLLAQGADPYSDWFGSESYNGITTIQNKTNLSFDRSIGGMMIWEISGDTTGTYSLLNAMNNIIQQRSGNTDTEAPYGGTARAIPGKIEAEDYDIGGEGVAYHDVDASNNGTAYRTDGVDIEACSDAGAGYDVGWIALGEYLKYTVNVNTSGTYRLDVRVASTTTGNTFHIELDGQNISGTITVPNTAGWQTWQTVSVNTPALTAGNNKILKVVMDGGNFNLNNVTFTVLQGPYNGTAASIPGKIEAENYDLGGEGVAYHDVDASNNGTAYRTDGVDIEACSDAGAGYDVGWIAAGEYLKYTVNVTLAAAYKLDVRVASTASGNTFHIELDGQNISGTITVPNTGGWQTWQTVSVNTPALTAGNNRMLKIVMDGGNFNLNNINFSILQGPYNGVAATIPGKIEAENYDLGGEGVAYHDADAVNNGTAYRNDGVDIQVTTDIGGGYNVGWIVAGEYLKYTVNVTAGTYKLDLRLASTSSENTFHVELEGQNISGTITVPNTGAWQTFQTVTVVTPALAAGNNRMLKVVMDGGSFNFNYLNFSTYVNQAPSVSITAPANNTSFTAPASISISANASDADGSVSKVDFYNGSSLLGSTTTSPYSYTWTNVAAGTYSITAKATDNNGATTTSASVSVTVNAQSTCNPVIWSDEFNGSSLDQSKWAYQTGDGCNINLCGWGNNEMEYYTNSTNNVSVSGGNLALTARYQPNYNGTGKDYTSGKVFTSGIYSHKYGRFEARIKIPSATGIWPGFWLLPDGGGWPQNGEIDILETVNKNSNWYGTLHYANSTGGHLSSGKSWAPPSDLGNDFHVYAADWTTDYITFYIDGINRGTITKTSVQSGGGVWPFDSHNFYIILNVAVGGNWPGAPNSWEYPVSMLVDYVRVYDNSPCTVPESPFGGVAKTIPGQIEAEDYDLGGEGVSYHDADATNNGGQYRNDAVDIEACSDVNGGYDVGYIASGEYLKYIVNVTSGTYKLDLRLASTSSGNTFHVELDGQNISGNITVPNTGGWQTWQTVSVITPTLSSGNNRILKVVMDGENFNLNYLSFSPSTAPAAKMMDDTAPSPATTTFTIAPNPVIDQASVSFTVEEDGITSLKVYDLYNNEVDVIVDQYLAAGSYTFQLGGSKLKADLYLLKLVMKGKAETLKIIKAQ